MQALYHWQLNPADAADLVNQYVQNEDPVPGNPGKADAAYLALLIEGVVEQADTLSAQLERYIDRPLEQLNPLERAILLIGLFELSARPEIPWRAVINEAVELARAYGAEGGHRYVNAVLDKAARELRETGETT